MTNIVVIHYCSQCRWLLRASWMAQELLSTFDQEIQQLVLAPGTGGVFQVTANEHVLWCRKDKGCFPEITELKRLVRDAIAPDKALGHIDRKHKGTTSNSG